METVGVRELRNNVAAVLRRAEAGERITVTVDGRPVARLVPLEPEGEPTMADLVAAGLVVAPRRRGVPPLHPEDPAVDVRLDDVLDELRGR